MNYKEKLIEYGLSENEAAIYLAAMELGPSPVQKIATQAKVNRVSTYNFIKSLTLKGLMSSYEEGKRTMYVASEPEKISNYFIQKKRELDDLEKEFNQLLPQFKTVYNSTNKPVVRFYEGFEGAIIMNEEMLEGDNETIEIVSNLNMVLQNIPQNVLNKIGAKRKDKQIKTVSIYEAEEGKLKSDENNTRLVIKDKNLPITADITLYQNKTRFISFSGGIFGIIIENKEITETLRSIFYLATKYLNK